jgi:hypothetical protein
MCSLKCLKFCLSDSKGLSMKQVSDHIVSDGRNIIPPPRQLPIWAKFILCFFKGFGVMLWVCAFFVFLSWEPFGTAPSNVYNVSNCD